MVPDRSKLAAFAASGILVPFVPRRMMRIATGNLYDIYAELIHELPQFWNALDLKGPTTNPYCQRFDRHGLFSELGRFFTAEDAEDAEERQRNSKSFISKRSAFHDWKKTFSSSLIFPLRPSAVNLRIFNGYPPGAGSTVQPKGAEVAAIVAVFVKRLDLFGF